jgi:hypothetical protein
VSAERLVADVRMRMCLVAVLYAIKTAQICSKLRERNAERIEFAAHEMCGSCRRDADFARLCPENFAMVILVFSVHA